MLIFFSFLFSHLYNIFYKLIGLINIFFYINYVFIQLKKINLKNIIKYIYKK